MHKLQTVRGMKDWFANDCELFHTIINKARNVAQKYQCQDLQTPILEHQEVFVKSLGESSDVVGKEMYNLFDKGGETLTLRPEFTAGIARAFFANGLQQYLPLRLFSYGPVFRYERPQRGRLRQFHQLNVEFLGPKSPFVDVELISCAIDFINIAGLDSMNDIEININSLGNLESRKNYRKILLEYFSDYQNDLSDDSKNRLKLNPLRILDSKDENDKKISINAPKLCNSLDIESQDYFAEVLSLLDSLTIKYKVNDCLVRGLDYYQHTIFEFVTSKLGAQGTVLAGGRYDGLYKMMGNVDVDAIGFGMGIERFIDLYGNNFDINKQNNIVIAVQDESLNIFALQLSQQLRINGFCVDVPYYKKGLGKKIQYADKQGAKLVLIIGQDEINNKQVKVKDLKKSQETFVEWDNLIDFLANNIF